MKRIAYLVFVLALLLAVVPATAQEETIAYGDVVEGSIDEEGASVNYQFEGNEGDLIAISMNAAEGSDLDPYLALLGPDGGEVANDDDGGSGWNALIFFKLGAGGTYTIVASDSFGYSTGAFTLSLSVASPQPVALGDAIVGEIPTPSAVVMYALEGTAGETIIVSMDVPEDSMLDPKLSLLDTDLNLITSDDDSGYFWNSIIAARLPADGTYYFLCTSGFDETGAFNLSVGTPEALEMGTMVNIPNFDDETVAVYAFDVAQAGKVTVEVTTTEAAGSDEMSLMVEVYDAVLSDEGLPIAGANGTHLAGFTFNVEETGLFFVRLTNEAWFTEGEVELGFFLAK